MNNKSAHHRDFFLGALLDLAVTAACLQLGLAWQNGHLVGMLVGVFGYSVMARWRTSPGVLPSALSRILIAACAAVILRGGFWAGLGLGLWPSGIPVLLSGWLGSWILFHGLAPREAISGLNPPQDPTERCWQLLVSTALLLTLFRLAYLQPVELLHEEAYHWLYAWNLDLSYLDHPPMVGWLIWLGTQIFGHSEFGVRFPAWILGIGSSVFLYLLTRRLFDRLTAATALLLMGLLPYYFGHAMVMMPDTPLIFAWVGAVYFFQRALLEGRSWSWLAAGGCLGFGMLSKYTISLLGLGVLVYILTHRGFRKWLLRPQPYMGAMIMLIIFSPVLVWNQRHQWASFLFQTSRRTGHNYDFDLDSLMLFVLLILTPLGVWAVIDLLRTHGLSARNSKSLAWPSAARRSWPLMLTMTGVPLAVFALASLARTTKFNWTGPVWLPLLPYLAHWCRASLKSPVLPSRAGVRPWPLRTGILLMTVYGIGLYYLAVGMPGISYPPGFSGLGWRYLGPRIEGLVKEAETETGMRPLVVGMDKDRTAAWSAFYRRAEPGGGINPQVVSENLGRHIFGASSGMFAFWQPNWAPVYSRLLLIANHPRHLTKKEIFTRIERAGPILFLPRNKNGKTAGSLSYRWVYGYKQPDQIERTGAVLDYNAGPGSNILASLPDSAQF